MAIAVELAGSPASGSNPPGPLEFLAELDRRDSAERANVAGGVTLSTIHRAKGLEWDAGFSAYRLGHFTDAATHLQKLAQNGGDQGKLRAQAAFLAARAARSSVTAATPTVRTMP